jgi:glutamate 5-kinase
VESETRHRNFTNTVGRLLDFGAVPIINENDTVATEEIVIGDNDTLAAIVAKSVAADLLIVCSDIDGLYDADPHTDPNAKLISEVPVITPEIEALAGGKGSALGTGGMITKLHAAKIAAEAGIPTVILNGNDPDLLYDVMEGRSVGTRFLTGGKR